MLYIIGSLSFFVWAEENNVAWQQQHRRDGAVCVCVCTFLVILKGVKGGLKRQKKKKVGKWRGAREGGDLVKIDNIGTRGR